MAISFDGIPATATLPFMYVEFDPSVADLGPSLMPYRILAIGQRLAAGTKPAGQVDRVTRAAQAVNYYGKGSMLAHMIERLLDNNQVTDLRAIALDDAEAGVKAAWSITVGGTVSAGTIELLIGGRRVRVGVATGDTLAEIATAIAAAIEADPDLAVSAEVDGDTDEQVNVTAKHKGAEPGTLDIRHSYYDGQALPDGLTLTIAQTEAGSGNPDVTDLFDVLGDTHYNVVAFPYTDAANLTFLEAELADRFGPLEMIDGVACIAMTGTHSELVTFGDGRNSPHVSVMDAHKSPTPAWEWAAAIAGVAAYYGNIDPGRPLQTLVLQGVLPEAEADRFSKYPERNLLVLDGVSTHYVDAGGLVRIEYLRTMYQESALGAEDRAYMDVETLLTLSYLRYDFRTYIAKKYPRHKLGQDSNNYGPGQKVMTPKLGRAEAIARFKVWEAMALVEDIEQFKRDLLVEIDASNPNRLNWRLPPNVINQFRQGAVQIQFRR